MSRAGLRTALTVSAGVALATTGSAGAAHDESFSRTHAAKEIAVEIMGDPCGGVVGTTKASLPGSLYAHASWSWGSAPHFTDCLIRFSSDHSFSWLEFCTIMVHEYGHLAGREHSDNPRSVMYPVYARPDPRCDIRRASMRR